MHVHTTRTSTIHMHLPLMCADECAIYFLRVFFSSLPLFQGGYAPGMVQWHAYLRNSSTNVYSHELGYFAAGHDAV